MAKKATATSPQVPRLEPPANLADEQTTPGSRVAVLIAHGMGQQIKFQTLNDLVVHSLHDAARRAGCTIRDVKARLIRDKDTKECRYLPRVEFTLDGNGQSVDVHAYECYWAPLTEGKVTLRDVAMFLLSSGVRGFMLGTQQFQRVIDGSPRPMDVGRWTRIQFALALLVVLSLFALNGVLGLITTASVLRAPGAEWPGPMLIGYLTWSFLLFEASVGVFLVGSRVAFTRWERFRKQYGTDHRQWVMKAGRPLLLVLAGAAIAGTIVAGVGSLVLLVVFRAEDAGPVEIGIFFYSVIGVAALVSTVVRRFLVQYLGDVVAYVSAHTVNQFWEVRAAIQEAVLNVGRAVYSQEQYTHVLLVGHSLGSVVVYDLYNALVNEEAPSDERARRTRLITFGSPLDKTAFVFRSQLSADALVREALATQVQASIAAPTYRPASWINIWSPDDWISGELNFYGAAVSLNQPDPEACIPLVAHTQYWRNALLGDTLIADVLESAAIAASVVPVPGGPGAAAAVARQASTGV